MDLLYVAEPICKVRNWNDLGGNVAFYTCIGIGWQWLACKIHNDCSFGDIPIMDSTHSTSPHAGPPQMGPVGGGEGWHGGGWGA